MKKIIISLTTFCGRCVEAIHYYVSVEYYDSCNDFRNDKIRRPITQKEIDSNGDRFYSYEEYTKARDLFLNYQNEQEQAVAKHGFASGYSVLAGEQSEIVVFQK